MKPIKINKEKLKRAVRDNPDLPPHFILNCLRGMEELRRGLCKPYTSKIFKENKLDPRLRGDDAME